MKRVLSAALVFIVVFQINAQLRVNSSGSVGIGVSSVFSKLHVKGNGVFVSSTSSIISAPYIRGTNTYSSAVTPDFTWWGNDQTGFYHPSAGKIGVSINGIERMTVDVSKIRLQGYHWTGGIDVTEKTFSGGYNMIAISPNTDWYGVLGSSSKRFAGGYIDHVWAATYTITSDERLKENIEGLNLVLPKLMKLNSVKYDLKPINNRAENMPSIKQVTPESYKERMGFLAQELKEVFPSVVEMDTATGYYGVNYMDLIPVLVEAIKEQQIQIEALRYNQQKSDKATRESEEELLSNATHLDQNFPNPFTSETSVIYFIAPEANSASIMIFDMKGTLLRTYKDLEKGKGEVVIKAGELTPGMYMYSLIVNGIELDNKRMILTE